jgi:hypothetical protein
MKRLHTVGLLLLFLTPGKAAPLTDSQREFFESRIRPILAQECYECHSEATKAKGGLLLDSRPGWEKGGESGPVLVPGKPDDSLLLRSIAHEIQDLKMPKAGAQLDPQIVEDFRTWIAMGAPDPRDTAPSPDQLEKDTDWKAISARRAQWWSFQPVKKPAVPEVTGVTHPVDRFIRDRLAKEGLAPTERADPRTLVRRLYFNLIGLPPTPEEAAAFEADSIRNPESAIRNLTDRLLADPAFGEKWARHWMDWTRYADTHGSEGDPVIPHASQYRDYLIRALNEDVPYDQLLLEHFAGDLLGTPRLDAAKKINESVLGLGHLRMVFHGFAPTDALDERVRFTDDQINTVTKAFLGLTVSCARCHDHKFDAISQADYYALFGIFSSALPATIAVDAPGVLERNRDELAALKPAIREQFAAAWSASLPKTPTDWEKHLSGKGDRGPALALLAGIRAAGSDDTALSKLRDAAKKQLPPKELSAAKRWDLSDPAHFETWSRYGEGLSGTKPTPAGEFSLTSTKSESTTVVQSILPAGAYSHLLSTKHRGVLASAPFDLDEEYDLHVLVCGEGGSVRYVVQHYPRSGTVYPVTDLGSPNWRWIKYDLNYWKGDNLHLELATAGDAPILVKGDERSWFGIREAVLVKKGEPAPASPDQESLAALFGNPDDSIPASFEEACALYTNVLQKILADWGAASPTFGDADALLLNEALQAGIFPNTLASLPVSLQSLVTRYRQLESEVPLPIRAPGVLERPGIDQPLFVRGDHKQPGPAVPRRFLEEIDATPYATQGTGRLEFARDLVDPKNPFTARVMVNRLWHHLFGEGIVPTVDNLGRLGEKPSHPELLDFLADRFRNEQDWSIKSLLHDLVLTDTWQQASRPSPEAIERDPANALLSSYPLRRLEAEAIRDGLLTVSGQLDRTPYGPPVGGSTPRRSLYLRVKRNDLDPLLTTFDFPVPASSVGRRDVTNVPAQSLTLLNDPFLIGQAKKWSASMRSTLPPEADDETRIHFLFESAVTRPPTDIELTGAKDFLAALDYEHGLSRERFSAVSAELQKSSEAIRATLHPIRTRLETERALAFEKEKGTAAPKTALRPVAHWDFERDTVDLVGGLALTLEGTARLENGALVVDEKGFAASSLLPFDLAEKTLEATVELTTLDQAGGGALTVQDRNGSVFDSIVFAERRKHEWLAGSNGFVRTLDFAAPAETAVNEAVHLVLTYAKDGTIRAYRNGQPWGDPIRKAELQHYKKGESKILLGLRHGTTASGNKTLRGRILEARLYARELSTSEIQSAFAGGPVPVTREDISALLTSAQRSEVTALETRLATLESEESDLRRLGADRPLEERRWQDLAHAIFNLKEFIYLR